MRSWCPVGMAGYARFECISHCSSLCFPSGSPPRHTFEPAASKGTSDIFVGVFGSSAWSSKRRREREIREKRKRESLSRRLPREMVIEPRIRLLARAEAPFRQTVPRDRRTRAGRNRSPGPRSSRDAEGPPRNCPTLISNRDGEHHRGSRARPRLRTKTTASERTITGMPHVLEVLRKMPAPFGKVVLTA